MLNSCPPPRSCGTGNPIWSDGELPKIIGVNTTVNAYLVYHDSSNCKIWTRPLHVMRCSWDTSYDVIYKYGSNDSYDSSICSIAFCGMK